MTLRKLIEGLGEDMLDVTVKVKVPDSSGTYTMEKNLTSVDPHIEKVRTADGLGFEVDTKQSCIYLISASGVNV